MEADFSDEEGKQSAETQNTLPNQANSQPMKTERVPQIRQEEPERAVIYQEPSKQEPEKATKAQKNEPKTQEIQTNTQKVEPLIQKGESASQKVESDIQKVESEIQKRKPETQKTESDIQKIEHQNQKIVAGKADIQKIEAEQKNFANYENQGQAKQGKTEDENIHQEVESSKHESKEEILEFTYNFWKDGPDCFEKHLTILHFLSYRLSFKQEQGKNANDKETIERTLSAALNRFEIELTFDRKLKPILDSLSSYIHRGNWSDLHNKVSEIFQLAPKIRPLNICEVRRLISKVKDAAKAIYQKDVILLLGGTGTGKSTTTHYLAGSKLVQTKVKGIPHIEAVSNDANPWIVKEIKCSPYSVSETRYITAVELKFKKGLNFVEIVLCDTPGFEDTGGAEVDIANGKGIVEALANTKSVRPLLFICKTDVGARLTGLRQLIRLILDMMPNMNKHLPSFNYIFTRYGAEDLEAINPKICDLHEQLSIEKDTESIQLLKVLEDLAEKTDSPEKINLVSPLDGHGSKLLSKLTGPNPINRPKENFQTFLSARSRSAISDQLKRDQDSMNKALVRNEFEYILFKLKEIIFLKEVLGLSQEHLVTSAISSTTNEIIQVINKRIEESLNLLERSLSSGNKLLSEDVENIIKESEKLKSAKNLIEFLRSITPDESKIPEVEALYIGFKLKIEALNEIANQADIISDSKTFKEVLEKLQLVAQTDASFLPYYEKQVNRLIGKQQSIINDSEDNQNLFSKFAKIQHISKEYKKFVPNLEQETDKLKTNMIEDLNNLVVRTAQICKTTIKEGTSGIIKNIFSSLKDQRKWNSEFEYALENDKFFEKIFEDSIDLLTKKATEVETKIENLFQNNDLGTAFSEVEESFSELYHLKMSDEDVGLRISLQYFKIFEKLGASLK